MAKCRALTGSAVKGLKRLHWVVNEKCAIVLIYKKLCYCRGIALNLLQLVRDLLRCGRQNRVTVVDARGLNKCFNRLNVQRATNTSQLQKPKETCHAYTWDTSVKTKVRRNSHTKQSNWIARFYQIVTKLERETAASK